MLHNRRDCAFLFEPLRLLFINQEYLYALPDADRISLDEIV